MSSLDYWVRIYIKVRSTNKAIIYGQVYEHYKQKMEGTATEVPQWSKNGRNDDVPMSVFPWFHSQMNKTLSRYKLLKKPSEGYSLVTGAWEIHYAVPLSMKPGKRTCVSKRMNLKQSVQLAVHEQKIHYWSILFTRICSA
jgi:hypothetical protein